MSASLLLAALLLAQDGAPAAAPAAITPAEIVAPAPATSTAVEAAGASPGAESAAPPASIADAAPPADAAPADPAPADSANAFFTPDAPEAKPLEQLARAGRPAPAAGMPTPPRSRWEGLPRIEFLPDYEPRPLWVERAQAIEKEGCRFPADAKGIVRLTVPFVALFDTRGRAVQAQADGGDCPALTAMVEQFAGQLGPSIVVPPGGPQPRWRFSRFLIGWEKDAE